MTGRYISAIELANILLRVTDLEFDRVDSIKLRVPGRPGFMDISNLSAERFLRELLESRFFLIIDIEKAEMTLGKRVVKFKRLSIFFEPNGEIFVMPTEEIDAYSEEDIQKVVDKILALLHRFLSVLRALKDILFSYRLES